MKRILSVLTTLCMAAAVVSCSYDDSDLWSEVEDVKDRVSVLEEAVRNANGDIDALQTIVDALQSKVTVERVETTATGYIIYFSDQTQAVINNGANGSNAPVVSVKFDETDNVYYWTIDGEWLLADGERVRASALDGEKGDKGDQGDQGDKGDKGADGITPEVRINPDTKEWEISTDGQTWTSTGVVAEGVQGAQGEKGDRGDSLFQSVDASAADYVVITLADKDSTQIKIAKSVTVQFTIKGVSPSGEAFLAGAVKTYDVTSVNVADYSISKPDGWKVAYADNRLTITAPADDRLAYADKSGCVSVVAVSASGCSAIAKAEVYMVELRCLTFEDADYKGSGNYLGNNDWSSLIDNPQYGGELLYGDYSDRDYNWYDENNTFLASELPLNWGSRVFWSGGHAVSNYVDMDLSHGDFNHQLSVWYKDANTGYGGHNGSQNFCVHYGYRDSSGFSAENLPFFYFGDGEARVIDHMWIMNTTYAVNCYSSGNGLTDKIGEDDWVKIIAIGYDENGEESGQCEFYTVKGNEFMVSEWTKWDLSPLGKVSMVEFNITGSSDNGAGFSQPAYFAYDDVAVEFRLE